MINEEVLKKDFFIIGNNIGEFNVSSFLTYTDLLSFNYGKGLYLNIFNNMDTEDKLIIYYNEIDERYFAVIINRKYLKIPKYFLPLFSKAFSSSYELSSLLDTFNLKLRQNNILCKKIKREYFKSFIK